ncbi:MAG: SIS domain-containing protein [Bacteroidota bacterium]
MLSDPAQLSTISQIVELFIRTFQAGNKVLFCGNGGSAADAQHLAAELSGRFFLDRKALFAEALHVNSSFLTAVANDFGFENAFARAVEAMGKKGDVLVALSTSGNSPNILKAIEAAKIAGLKVVGMTGESGGKMAAGCDLLVKIPSQNTPRIQEGHILVGHVVCELVERRLFRP